MTNYTVSSTQPIIRQHLLGSMNVYINQSLGWTVNINSRLVEQRRVIKSGVRRKKPTGFMPPTDFNVVDDYTGVPLGSVGSINRSFNSGTNVRVTLDLQAATFGSTTGANSFVKSPGMKYTRAQAESLTQLRASSALSGAHAQLSVAFAERKKTGEMVNNNLKRIDNAVLALRKGKPKEAFANFFYTGSDYNRRDRKKISKRRSKFLRKGGDRLLKMKRPARTARELNNLWLEWRYGWRPTLLDISNAMELLNDDDLKQPHRYSVSAKGTWKQSGSRVFPITESSNVSGFRATARYHRVVSSSQVYMTRIDAFFPRNHLGRLNDFGFVNAASVAWELVPASFVVDWFIPIGTYLDAFGGLTGMVFRAGSTTSVDTVRTTHLDTSIRMEYVGNGSFGSVFLPPTSYVNKHVVRKVHNSWPRPLPPLAMPKWTPSRILDSVALLASRFIF